MPPDPCTVRDASPADIPAIARIYADEVRMRVASFEEVPPSEAELAERLANIRKAGLPYFVAERDGAVLGYAYASRFHTRAAYRYTVENTVYVDPVAQRQGVGSALLRKVIESCEAAGYRQMIALIVAENRDSLALHKKFDFRLLGNAGSIGFKFDRWLDVTYMQRALGPGDSTTPDRPAPGQPVRT